MVRYQICSTKIEPIKTVPGKHAQTISWPVRLSRECVCVYG